LNEGIKKNRDINRVLTKNVLWVEPSHFNLDNSLHKMADLEISRQLAKKGINTFLLVVKSRKSFFFKTEYSQVRTISIPIRHVPLISSIIYAVTLLFYLPVSIIAIQPTFIIVVPDVSILSFLPIVSLSRLKKIKIILDVRSVPVETKGFVGFLQKFWFALSIHVSKQFFDGMTVITPLMKKDLSGQYRIKPVFIGVWTSGVSLKLFSLTKFRDEGQKMKSNLGLYNKFIVFYHGVFTASRGLKETIECISLLRRNYPDIVLFLLGTGTAKLMLTNAIRDLNLENNVIIHDPVEYTEVPKFIAMSDVCIVPLPNLQDWRSQSPLKLLEYLSMEKVVILTDIPAHRFVIGNQSCGIYISSIRPSEIANSIEFAYRNREMLKDWAKSSRSIVSKDYSWEKVTADLQAYLMSI
jgi:glycosyltransferase involved in cell wall biosynthesis